MGTLPEDVRTIMVISGLIRLTMRHMLQKNLYRKSDTHFMFTYPPLKSGRLRKNVAKDDNIIRRHALCFPDR